MKNLIKLSLVTVILISLITVQIRSYIVKNNIKKSENFIIARLTSTIRYPKSTDFNFTYIIDGKLITTANGGVDFDILNSDEETRLIKNLKVNSFYLAKFNPKYPNIIIVDKEKQVTDTVAILKAGFSKEEINE